VKRKIFSCLASVVLTVGVVPVAYAQSVAAVVADEVVTPQKALVRDVSGLVDFTVSQIPGLDRTEIGAIVGIKNLALGQFPGLTDTPLTQIPEVAKALGINLGGDIATGGFLGQAQTINSLIQGGGLPTSVLSDTIGSIGGFDKTPLGAISGIGNKLLGAIPGLSLTPLALLNFTCLTPQLVDHPNKDFGGFLEFAAPAQRYPVGKEIECANLKFKLASIDEAAGTGKFEFFVPGPFGSWLGPFPWLTAKENAIALVPLGNVSTSDSDKGKALIASRKQGVGSSSDNGTKDKPKDQTKDKPKATTPKTQSEKQSAIATTAKDSVGKLSTKDISGTNNGKVGCAAAVNAVVKESTGKEIGGGLSTAAMDSALQSGAGTRISVENAKAGDVIISPTSGAVSGHVGICAEDGCKTIYSNSSSSEGLFKQNFTIGSWNSTFQGKGLPVKIYQVK
jgi:hypothetical protein